MALDYHSIKNSSKESLVSFAKILDPLLNEKPADYYSVQRGYTVRGYFAADIIFSVVAWHGKEYYETPNFTVVVREVIKKPPLEVAQLLIEKYRGNILLVKSWEPKVTVEEIINAFNEVNKKLRVVWWEEVN